MLVNYFAVYSVCFHVSVCSALIFTTALLGSSGFIIPTLQLRKPKQSFFFFFFGRSPQHWTYQEKTFFLINYFSWRIIYNILMVFSILSQHESATGIHLFPHPETPPPPPPYPPCPSKQRFLNEFPLVTQLVAQLDWSPGFSASESCSFLLYSSVSVLSSLNGDVLILLWQDKILRNLWRM